MKKENFLKHIKYFDDFLSDHVNLNQSRIALLEGRISAITKLLKSTLAGYRKYSEQGSYAHKTIIKPVKDDDGFDADLLILIKDEDFDPSIFDADYVDKIYQALKTEKIYKDKIHRNSRCVTVDYSGDFHLDLVPCIEHKGNHYICNRKEGKYETTDGDGYKSWLSKKNSLSTSNYLRKVTRLLKFLRDHKENFSVKSILLTTLLGNEITDSDSDFSDFPTALKELSNRVNKFLQDNGTMPIIKNPIMPEEDFNRHWNQKKYKNFRDKFNLYTEKINDAFDEKNHNDSVKKWRKVFGDEFGGLINNSKKSSAKIAIGPILATKPYGKAPWSHTPKEN